MHRSSHRGGLVTLTLAIGVCGASAQGLGPAAGAVDAWFRSAARPLCTSADGTDTRCTARNGPRYTVGYAPDGVAAIAFVRFQADPTGNAENLEVATFRAVGERWVFVRKVGNILGQGPGWIGFEGGRAVFTMEVLRENDARCCPTGTRRHAVPVP